MMSGRNRFFSAEHIQASSFSASPALAEQAIHCLELVCELSETGFPFQFKGGNSLLLILDEPERFSIDVDIATDWEREEIERTLSTLVDTFGVFTRWEKRQHATKPWIPLSSYRLFYPSSFSATREADVMLDAQLHTSPYPCRPKRVACGTLFSSDTCVTVPLPGSIIGDKLLTLGPSTLGIPLGKGKAAQRLKHVFDISRVLATGPSLHSIKESFEACLAFENRLQQRDITTDDVVRDTLASCWSVMRQERLPVSVAEGTVLIEHVQGHAPFAAHLFRSGYSWTDLQVDMARAACCIAAVGAEVSDPEFASLFSKLSRNEALSSGYAQARGYWERISSWIDCNGLPGWCA